MRKLLAGVLIVGFIAVAYWLVWESGLLALILDRAAFRNWLATYGMWGPLTVIGLMAAAILVSPIPSAPIAVAAGAAYGHIWGTFYILSGAEIGAVAAFVLARILGREAMQRWFGDRLTTGWAGSQNTLMGLVFVSRLIPFISFDVISYAAGLTVVSLWRFAIATAAGIVPASFLLAHFGEEMTAGDEGKIIFSVFALGAITAVPFGVTFIRAYIRKRHSAAEPKR